MDKATQLRNAALADIIRIAGELGIEHESAKNGERHYFYVHSDWFVNNTDFKRIPKLLFMAVYTVEFTYMDKVDIAYHPYCGQYISITNPTVKPIHYLDPEEFRNLATSIVAKVNQFDQLLDRQTITQTQEQLEQLLNCAV